MTSIRHVLLVPWSMYYLVMRHPAQISTQFLREMCPCGLQPDLAARDYFLCGYVKSNVYGIRPADICDSKQRIWECMQGIPKEMPQQVVTALPITTTGAVERHVVTHKQPYYKSNDLYEFSGTCNVHAYLLTYLLNYSMEQSPSWEANRFSASQEIPRILWNPKVHYRSHNSFLPVPSHPTSWRSILLLSSHLRLGLPSALFPSGFLTKILYTPLFSPIRATCPAHLILLYVITRTILGEQYRSLSSSLCSFLHSTAQILSSTLYSQTPSAYISPSMSATKFHTHTKQQAKL